MSIACPLLMVEIVHWLRRHHYATPPALLFVGQPPPRRPPPPPTRRIEILESGGAKFGKIPVVEIGPPLEVRVRGQPP